MIIIIIIRKQSCYDVMITPPDATKKKVTKSKAIKGRWDMEREESNFISTSCELSSYSCVRYAV